MTEGLLRVVIRWLHLFGLATVVGILDLHMLYHELHALFMIAVGLQRYWRQIWVVTAALRLEPRRRIVLDRLRLV